MNFSGVNEEKFKELYLKISELLDGEAVSTGLHSLRETMYAVCGGYLQKIECEGKRREFIAVFETFITSPMCQLEERFGCYREENEKKIIKKYLKSGQRLIYFAVACSLSIVAINLYNLFCR